MASATQDACSFRVCKRIGLYIAAVRSVCSVALRPRVIGATSSLENQDSVALNGAVGSTKAPSRTPRPPAPIGEFNTIPRSLETWHRTKRDMVVSPQGSDPWQVLDTKRTLWKSRSSDNDSPSLTAYCLSMPPSRHSGACWCKYCGSTHRRPLLTVGRLSDNLPANSSSSVCPNPRTWRFLTE